MPDIAYGTLSSCFFPLGWNNKTAGILHSRGKICNEKSVYLTIYQMILKTGIGGLYVLFLLSMCISELTLKCRLWCSVRLVSITAGLMYSARSRSSFKVRFQQLIITIMIFLSNIFTIYLLSFGCPKKTSGGKCADYSDDLARITPAQPTLKGSVHH